MNNNENVQKNECSCNTENGKKIVEMLETERKRIVSELHDTSLQNIAHFVHMIELASLYIDHEGVVLLNGTIHISSEIGQGTTIDIKIPLDLHLAEK